MTTTNTNINVPQSSNSIQLNPHDYVNKGINDITLEYFNLINPEQKKSIQTLFLGVGILIGADIFKSIIQNMIRDNQKNINDFLLSGLQLFSFSNIKNYFNYTKNNFFSIYNYCKYSFIKKKNNHIVLNQDNNLSFEIKCDELFYDNLIMLLENYHKNKNSYQLINNIEFRLEYDNKVNINQSDTTINKKIFDIKIIYDNDFLLNLQNISYEYNPNKNITKLIITEINLYDILSKKYINDPNFLFSDTNYSHYNMIEQLYENINIYDRYLNLLINFLVINLVKQTKSKITNKKKNIIYFNIDLLTFILYKSSNKVYFNNLTDDIYTNLKKFKIESSYNLFPIGNYFPDIKPFKSDIEDLLTKFNDYLKYNLSENNLSENNLDEKKFSDLLNINIEYNKNYSKSEINNKLISFVDYVQSISKKHKINKKINIYTINTKIKKLTDKYDNPEYIKYSETKKKLVAENKDINTKDIINIIGIEPDQYICTEKINYEIEKKVVNSKYCSFDNLYLRKEQDIRLFNLTERFSNDKKLMEELGIPNKLGILLYGEPGCGKTTTIITLGSYLGRDIFYLNLKSVKTNQELKMIFDYVNLEHSCGGIIVLEDIDAMTNIVMNRLNLTNPINPTNTNNIVDSGEDSVTLEYLLNLLDGTLTFNDSVVVITTNYLEKLDPALYRPGRIDNLIEMEKCDHYQISSIFKRFIGRDIDSNILYKIPENNYTPARIIFHLINWVKKREESDSIIMSEFIK